MAPYFSRTLPPLASALPLGAVVSALAIGLVVVVVAFVSLPVVAFVLLPPLLLHAAKRASAASPLITGSVLFVRVIFNAPRSDRLDYVEAFDGPM